MPDEIDRTAQEHRRQMERLGLVLILMLGAGLRLVGIMDTGVRHEDEAAYVADARMWHRLAETVADPSAIQAWWQGDQAAWDAAIDRHGVHFEQRHPKPCQGYTWLGSLMMVPVGDRPEALLVLNALLGTITILVGYAIARSFCTAGVAMLAALILATSPYHLAYCRGAWTEPASALLILLSIWCWMRARDTGRSRRRWMWGAGLAIGYAFCCHYRAAMIAVILVTWAAGRLIAKSLQRRRIRARHIALFARSLAPFLAGAAVPTIALEFVTHGLRWLVGTTGISLPLATFVEAGVHWIDVVAKHTAYMLVDTNWHTQPALAAIYSFFATWHGPAAAVLVVIGLVVSIRRGPHARLLATIIVVSLLLWSMQPFVLGRLLVVLLPIMFMAMAIGAGWVMARVGPRPTGRCVALVVLAGLIATPALTKTAELLEQRSQIADAATFIAKQGEVTLVVPRGGIRYLVYLDGTQVDVVELGRADARANRGPKQALDRLQSEGVRWFLTDASPWHRPSGDYIHEWWLDMERTLASSAALAAEYPDVATSRWAYLAEAGCTANLDAMTSANGGPIRIYDITENRTASAAPSPR